ncbi:MAG TPA: DUF4384 domain-containing protein [Blastocatellia bacterium]|nr:DUF4384 domain-containing protein [Blastocatellia bacterium]
MIHRKKLFRPWGRIITTALLGLCCLWAVAGPLPQRESEDRTRRVWNKRFREARDRTLARRPKGTNLKGELIGITLWRLRDDQDKPTAERATTDTAFTEGERLRISVEAPRTSDGYLYVIDSEIYADGSTGDPYLIFPSQTTPEGGNLVSAGKPVFVPAQGDEYPYFTLERVRKDLLREELTIIVSQKPLKLSLGTPAEPVRLERTQVAQWEKQWGGRVERKEERGGAGKQWTAAEREADKGERRLRQGDPLPQTIYLVRAKPGAPMMLRVPLQIAPMISDSRLLLRSDTTTKRLSSLFLCTRWFL